MSVMMMMARISIWLLLLCCFLVVGLDGAKLSEQQIKAEWMDLSRNNTRQVFNFAIGSLLNWGSRQYTTSTGHHDEDFELDDMILANVSGIRRVFGDCGRYVAVTAIPCDGEDQNSCPPVLGAFFEVTQESYPPLRQREAEYSLLGVTPEDCVSPLPDRNAFYFTWSGGQHVCDAEQPPPSRLFLSQAYWDFMIGGILAWDGKLLENRYTWDLAAESELGETKMQQTVAHYPSISLQKRRGYALQFVKTTAPFQPRIPLPGAAAAAEDDDGVVVEWINDRPCPLTFNSITTPFPKLHYPSESYRGQQPTAIGTASPIASKHFYATVDGILEEAGWNIHDRSDFECETTDYIERRGWEDNPYYDDVRQWRHKMNME